MKKAGKFSLIVLFAVCALLAQSQAFAVGIVRGTVSDPSGAVIPKASVRLTSNASGYDRTIPTDKEGRYRFVNVPPGEFTLHVEAPGFAPVDFTDDGHNTASVLHNIQFKGASAVQQITV